MVYEEEITMKNKKFRVDDHWWTKKGFLVRITHIDEERGTIKARSLGSARYPSRDMYYLLDGVYKTSITQYRQLYTLDKKADNLTVLKEYLSNKYIGLKDNIWKKNN
jgi:hypothetical protein